MAPKTGPSLKELMKNRNKVPSPQDKNKSKPPVNPPPPPPPQLPADLGLKPNPDLRRKRHPEATEEGELGPSKGSKQPRQSHDQRNRRSNSGIAERSLRWPKCAAQPVLGRPCWRWMVCQLRMMPPSGIIAGGTLVW